MPRRAKGPRLYFDKARRSWVIRDGGRFVRTGCAEGDTAGAERELRAYIAHKYRPPDSDDPSIADVLLAYRTEHVPKLRSAQNTLYNIGSLASWWGTRRVSDISAKTCREYAAGRTPQAARRDLDVLAAALRHWRREHRPIVMPPIVMPDRAPRRERWLTREEARRLRHAAMPWPHLYRFIVLGLLTGSRSGAIRSLRWEWIDLDARLMARRAPGTAEQATKRTPPVRIGRPLARLLRVWKRRDGDCPWVVHYNGRPIGDAFSSTWRQAIEAAGLRGVTPHHLRHTRATWLMREGVDPWEAAGHLGMSVRVLESVYGHHHPSHQERASEV